MDRAKRWETTPVNAFTTAVSADAVNVDGAANVSKLDFDKTSLDGIVPRERSNASMRLF